MILCADTYGKSFFKKLTNRLKDEGLIPKFHICVDRFYGPCNPKMDRQMRVFAYLRQFSFFIIVVDADGRAQNKIRETIESHIGSELKASTITIVLDYEIEDWLCASGSICVKDNKPSIILKQIEGYEKFRLPDYVPKLDIEKLTKQCKSFCNFLKFLQTCSKKGALDSPSSK